MFAENRRRRVEKRERESERKKEREGGRERGDTLKLLLLLEVKQKTKHERGEEQRAFLSEWKTNTYNTLTRERERGGEKKERKRRRKQENVCRGTCRG